MEITKTQKQQDEADKKRRKASKKLSARELTAVLANTEGLRRLRAVTAEEWVAADKGAR